MTTKAQEREALEKIVAILGTLETDSYVNTAFAGCVEDARENIENDFACSWKDRAMSYLKDAREFETEMRAARNERDAAIAALDKAEAENAELWKRVAALEKDCKDTDAERAKTAEEAFSLSVNLDAARAEIIKLKARLYDLLCAE